MDTEYGRRYRELYQKHWWWRAREQVVMGLIRDLSPPGGYGQILDVGCGDGLLFGQLTPYGSVEGVEPDAGLVQHADSTLGRIHLRPFDSTFDRGKRYGLILMLDVLEHMDEPAEAVRHAMELLVPGGQLLVTVPAFLSLWTSHDVLNEHRTRYTRPRLRELLVGSGLEVEIIRYMFHWLTVAKLAVRAKEGLFGGEPKPPVLPSRRVNSFLLELTTLEQRVVARIPMPFGSSILAVARRPLEDGAPSAPA